MSNYSRKAQAPYNKINKNSVITEFQKCPISGWVLVALDAEVRLLLTLFKHQSILIKFLLKSVAEHKDETPHKLYLNDGLIFPIGL